MERRGVHESTVKVDKPIVAEGSDLRGQTSWARTDAIGRVPRPATATVNTDRIRSAGSHRTTDKMARTGASSNQLGPSPANEMCVLGQTPGLLRQSTHGKCTVEARVSTEEVLETFREALTIEIAKKYCRADRAGYSMASGYCGASISVLTGIRAMFKP